MNSIFVEGKDKIFIEAYLTFLFQDAWKGKLKIISTNGWTNIDNFSNELLKTSDIGFRNFLIFDADYEHNNGGFATRLAALDEKKQTLGVRFATFLFPNNSDDGDFELLLERIVNPDHVRILECFNQYEVCLSQYRKDDHSSLYSIPIRKAKMYSYIDAFPKTQSQKREFKNGNYFFENSQYWNLTSFALEPLKAFLTAIVDASE